MFLSIEEDNGNEEGKPTFISWRLIVTGVGLKDYKRWKRKKFDKQKKNQK